MEIGIFLDNYEAGGVESVIANKIQSWPDHGCRFNILYNHLSAGVEKILRNKSLSNVNFVPLRLLTIEGMVYRRGRKIHIRCFGLILRYLFLVYNYFLIKKALKALPCDSFFIHHGGYPGSNSVLSAILAWYSLFSTKSILVIHNLHCKKEFTSLSIRIYYGLFYSKIFNYDLCL